MEEQRKYAILFAATILAARRKLNDIGSTPWAIESAIHDAIGKAERILAKIDERWPSDKVALAHTDKGIESGSS